MKIIFFLPFAHLKNSKVHAIEPATDTFSNRTPNTHLHQTVLTSIFLWGIFILATGYSGTLISYIAAPAYHAFINRYKNYLIRAK